MSKSAVRVRFAPSPTGYMHVGGVRTALFNWLFARAQNGSFLLRFEDTDQERLVADAANNIMESLQWLGIDWDEGPQVDGDYGPYWQSQRLHIYRRYAEQLLASGRMYRDWTPPEQLQAMRKEAQQAKRPFKVDRSQLITEGDPQKPHVFRFAIDPDFDPTWDDIVYGAQNHRAATLDDYVCIKSDGWPTYNFANVIDDHEMHISHVLRGDEFLSSTPKFLQLYAALGWKPPRFAHVPPVLGPDKAKLSKRHGALSVLEYRDQGYPPEALINFLATLGWNDGSTQELFTLHELIDRFQLERIQNSPAIFDMQRLEWMSGHHIRQMPTDKLLQQAARFWPPKAAHFDDTYKQHVLALVQERIKYWAELPDLSWFFFRDPDTYPKQLDYDFARQWLPTVIDKLNASDFSEDDLEQRLRALAADYDLKTGQLFQLIRISATGQTAAPGLFETLHVLGKEATLRRLHHVSDTAKNMA